MMLGGPTPKSLQTLTGQCRFDRECTLLRVVFKAAISSVLSAAICQLSSGITFEVLLNDFQHVNRVVLTLASLCPHMSVDFSHDKAVFI
jgi:hypothetical protein